MKILLLGEYSHVHWTLAEGLRALGHEVCVLSNGDYWKRYRSDILLTRREGKPGGISYLWKVLRVLPSLRGYDVVQIINPCFLELKAERCLAVYRYLKRHNAKVFLGAFGNDYYWARACTQTDTFRYSEFRQFGKESDNEATRQIRADWIGTAKERANREIARTCDGIVAGLYEYHAAYKPVFPEKTTFIPFPINMSAVRPKDQRDDGVVRFFIGIQRHRSVIKGTDVMLRALERVVQAYPGRCSMTVVESVPFEQYQDMMNRSDVLLDQLYSYTPAMNALLAMAKGLVVVGGGEPEHYALLREEELRPIVNVLPDEQDVFRRLEELVRDSGRIPELSRQSVAYVQRHHDHIKVARQYLGFWTASPQTDEPWKHGGSGQEATGG